MSHQRRLYGWHRGQMGKGSATGAVFKEAGRHLVVLTGDLIAGPAAMMTGGRKKKKGFH